MLVAIIGGCGSGKSQLAEQVCTTLGGQLIYIATMPVYSKEDQDKVARHRALRAGKGFHTWEMPKHLETVKNGTTVLFECLSTFVANRMFSGEHQDDWVTALEDELALLINRSGHTVVVSADVSGEPAQLDRASEEYRAVLTALNCWLCDRADAVVECVYGIPLVLKGELPC